MSAWEVILAGDDRPTGSQKTKTFMWTVNDRA